MNVLITSASRKVGLIEAFKKALAREGGGKVFGADINPLSPSFYFSDGCFLSPRDSDPLFAAKLLEFCQKNQIKLVVPTRDEELLLFAKHRDKFENNGIKIMICAAETLNICADKLKFAEFCQNNSLLVPRVYSLGEIRQKKEEFPLFIYDRFG